MDAHPGTDAQEGILDLVAPLRRYVSAHARHQQDVDDVVQETLLRVMEARERLAVDTEVAYAIVVARRVLADQAAAAERTRRHGPRLVDLSEPERPDEKLVRVEEGAALTAALAGLPEKHRAALLAHVVDDRPVATLATDGGTSHGSVTAQLARTRARLRLDYVLALRDLRLPTARCRPVLLAVSAADARRQDALRAGQHLLTCATCAEVSRPLLRRRSALVAILPWLGIAPLLQWLRRAIRATPGQGVTVAAGATALTAVAAVAVTSAQQPDARAPVPAAATASPAATVAAPPAMVRRTDGTPVVGSVGSLQGDVGRTVVAEAAPVVGVAADEGFWVGDGRGGRIWVQLVRTGRESPATVRAGARIGFTATVTRHGAGFARRVGVTAAEDAAVLDRQGAHLEVDDDDVRVTARDNP